MIMVVRPGPAVDQTSFTSSLVFSSVREAVNRSLVVLPGRHMWE
jgi:hypothetical protein